jgi:hypothetical protein
MELLINLGQVEAHFGLLEDGVNIGVRKVHGLRLMYHGQENLFGRTR